jgi:S-layer protein
MSMSFNAAFYLDKYPDVLLGIAQKKVASAEAHWKEFGAAEGRDPNANFDTKAYFLNNGDVLSAGVNPLTHFLEFGAAEGRSPSPTFVKKAQFDTAAYAAANTDLAEAGITTPAALYEHFAKFGFAETRPGVQTTDGVAIIDGVSGGAVGTTFTLTTGVDAPPATAGNDTISGAVSGTAALTTYSASDVIDGGAGIDTLNVTLEAAATAAVVKDVENVNVRAVATTTFDAGSITGATTFAAAGGTNVVTVNNITSLSTAAKVSGQSVGATFNYANSLLTGNSDAVSVIVDGVTGGTVSVGSMAGGGIETINLAGTGTASKAFTLTETGTSLTKVNISGDQTVGLTVTDASITTLDASANTAGVDVDARALTGTFAITGTAKDDRVVVSNANTSVADTVTGGLGTDTLGVVVANGATYTHSTNTKVTGFDNFELIDDGTVAAQTVTAALDGAFTSLKIGGGNAGNDAFVFTGVADKTTLTLGVNAATVSSTLKSNTSTDSLTVVLDGITTTGAVTAGSTETVTVTSQADSGNNANALGALTVTGATKLNIGGAQTANLGTVTTAANSAVVASTFTGATLTANLSGAVVKTYTGSAGKDLITIAGDSLNSANTFAGGAGTADTLTDGGVTGNQGILNVTGFETVTTTLVADAVLDVRNVTDMTKLIVNSKANSITVDRLDLTTTEVTINETTNGAGTMAAVNLTANTGSALKLKLTSDNVADTITTLTLDNGITSATLDVDGNAAGDGIVVTNAISTLGLTSLTVTGDGLLNLGGTQAANLVTFDASASTGAQTVTLGATTGATSVKGGSAIDTFVTGASSDVINGNGEADVITTGAGKDVVLIDTAAETKGAGYSGADTIVEFDAITDFTATGDADKIQFGTGVDAYGSGITLSAATAVNVTAVTAANAADLDAVFAAIQTAQNGTASTSALLQVYDVTLTTGAVAFDGGAAGRYAIVNDGTAVLNSADSIIDVTGITGALTAADFLIA